MIRNFDGVGSFDLCLNSHELELELEFDKFDRLIHLHLKPKSVKVTRPNLVMKVKPMLLLPPVESSGWPGDPTSAGGQIIWPSIGTGYPSTHTYKELEHYIAPSFFESQLS